MTDEQAAIIFKLMSFKMPCAYCGTEMDDMGPELKRPTKDHIWTKSMRSLDKNMRGTVWCCAQCNMDKSNMSPSEWFMVMRDRGWI